MTPFLLEVAKLVKNRRAKVHKLCQMIVKTDGPGCYYRNYGKQGAVYRIGRNSYLRRLKGIEP